VGGERMGVKGGAFAIGDMGDLRREGASVCPLGYLFHSSQLTRASGEPHCILQLTSYQWRKLGIVSGSLVRKGQVCQHPLRPSQSS
jgi:hypothetical protein